MKKLFESILCIIIIGLLAIFGWVYRQEIKTGIKKFVTFLEQTKSASVEEELAPLFVDDCFTGVEEGMYNVEKIKI